MTERGGGRIINGLSAGAFMAGGIYGVSKYALHGLTATSPPNSGRRGINVNGIAPGLVASPSGYVSLPKDSPFRDILGAADPRQDLRPARGLGRHDAPAVLTGGRLDQRPNDLGRRWLDHAAVDRSHRDDVEKWKTVTEWTNSQGAPGGRESRVRAHHDDAEARTRGCLHRVRSHRLRLRRDVAPGRPHPAETGAGSRSHASARRERSRRSKPTSMQR